jgi:hypothetical protein
MVNSVPFIFSTMTVLLPVQEMKQAQHNLPFLVGGKIYD